MHPMPLAIVAFSLLFSRGGSPLSAEIKAIHVVHEDFPKDAFQFAPVTETGTRLLVLVKSAKKTILGLENESRVDSMTDSEGKNLLPKQPEKKKPFSGFQNPAIEPFPKISKDGKLMAVKLKAPLSPKAGSASVKVDATLVVKVASGSEQRTSKGVKLAKGPVPMGEFNIEIVKAESKKNWQKQEIFSVQVRLKGEASKAYKELRFLDSSGKSLEAIQRSSVTSFAAKTIDFELPKPASEATLELSLWRGLEVIPVRLRVDQALGF
ncbi:MAG: hypothetical protein ACE5F1_19965 [Planctomycetota bacterium]